MPKFSPFGISGYVTVWGINIICRRGPVSVTSLLHHLHSHEGSSCVYLSFGCCGSSLMVEAMEIIGDEC